MAITLHDTILNGCVASPVGTLVLDDTCSIVGASVLHDVAITGCVSTNYSLVAGSGSTLTSCTGVNTTDYEQTIGSCKGVAWESWPTNLTGSNVVVDFDGTTYLTFDGGDQTFGDASVAGANYAFIITGSNTFTTLTIDRSTAAKTIKFTDGTTQTVTNFLCPTASTTMVALNGTSTAGWTITKAGGGIISLDYLALSYSTATPASTWYAGQHSYIAAGTVSGWIFGAYGAPQASFMTPWWPNIVQAYP